jgi:hypothetical protein
MGRGVRLAIALISAIALFGVPAAQATVVPITPPDQEVQDVALGSNVAGDYLAAWEQSGSEAPLGVMEGSAASALPSGPIQTVGEPGASIPYPAVAPDGTRGVIWAVRSSSASSIGSSNAINVALREPGSSGWTIQTLAPPSPANNQFDHALAFGPQGQALAVWADAGTGDRHPRLLGSFRPAGGAFGAPYVIYVDPVRNGFPSRLSIGMDDTGRPTLVWIRPTTVSISRGSRAGKHRPKRRKVETSATVAVTGDANGGFGSPQVIAVGCDGEDFDEATSGAAAIGLV